MIKLSEQVRRLEDSIESLRAENKKLRDWIEPSFDERDEIIDHQKWEISKLKEQIKKLTELNEQLTNTSNDGTKLIWQLKSELLARVKQVEDLQSSYKTVQKENERLKSKLKQTVDEYDEDYQTFTDDINDDLCNLANWRIDVENFFNKRMR